jgi:hypothetical protein
MPRSQRLAAVSAVPASTAPLRHVATLVRVDAITATQLRSDLEQPAQCAAFR